MLKLKLGIFIICIIVGAQTFYFVNKKFFEREISKSPTQKAMEFSVKKDNLANTIKDMEKIGNRIFNKNQWKAAEKIHRILLSYGYDTYIDSYHYKNTIWPNVICNKKGEKDNRILLIAHLDTKNKNKNDNSPGADDNGTGVAALLECARILKNFNTINSIQFCVFSNEEIGSIGSKKFVQKLTHFEKSNVKAVINLDVLGYNKVESPIYLSAIKANKKFLQKSKAVYKMVKNYFLYIFEGKNLIKVAGRKENKFLGELTKDLIAGNSKTRVKLIIDDDCG